MTRPLGQSALVAHLAFRAPIAIMERMKTSAIFFPFDLFGSGGAGAGALAIADAFDELRERATSRAVASGASTSS